MLAGYLLYPIALLTAGLLISSAGGRNKWYEVDAGSDLDRQASWVVVVIGRLGMKCMRTGIGLFACFVMVDMMLLDLAPLFGMGARLGAIFELPGLLGG